MASDYPNMDTLYAKLKNIGFDKKFVKRMLPDWWDEECETHPDGILEGVLYISRRLNLELNSLLDDSFIPKIKAPCLPKFKLSTKVNEPNRLLISCSLASRIAELTSFACKNEYQNIANLSVTDIRQAILENNSYVSLENTLDFCWSIGIPIIHFAELPKIANKFDGMVTSYDDRPIIIISRKDKSESKLLFIVLHELGHIQRNHINNEYWIDENIELDSTDSEEIEANQFANLILFNNSGINYNQKQPRPKLSGEGFAKFAQQHSDLNLEISPQAIINNLAWHRANSTEKKNVKKIIYGSAKKALKIVGEDSDAPTIINGKLKNNLAWDNLSEDNQEYLEIMTAL